MIFFSSFPISQEISLISPPKAVGVSLFTLQSILVNTSLLKELFSQTVDKNRVGCQQGRTRD